MSTRQSQKVTESERCTVSIEGLSSSTTDAQLKNLLRSIGPIEMFKMMPQQRKAIAKFSSPQHAESFQMSFHRSHPCLQSGFTNSDQCSRSQTASPSAWHVLANQQGSTQPYCVEVELKPPSIQDLFDVKENWTGGK
ncbi:hypothetical protein F2P81_019100 [Scophthalmus maximus]|uniref:RRM domain-containing protein n=1 Tax=Scophthalmus maximus TaxID=52904 RepID=A0A6A4S0W2_SCOMX|nr:hypothetical protein F2P81_019100 [Scophthalmus maximus]